MRRIRFAIFSLVASCGGGGGGAGGADGANAEGVEMLKAAKKATSPKLKLGYIRHALDEYRHTGLLFEVLSNQVKRGVGEFKREYKFSPQNVILKGYVDKEGFLVEKFPLKVIYRKQYELLQNI